CLPSVNWQNSIAILYIRTISRNARSEMAETEREYTIGYGKPPIGRRFRKGQSGNPLGPRKKTLSALLVAALDEPATVTAADGQCRQISKREAIVAQFVDKSAMADLRATKML